MKLKSFFKNEKNINLLIFISLIILAIVFAIVGTFYDYQFSKLVYNRNNLYSKIFGLFGGLPFFISISLAGLMLFHYLYSPKLTLLKKILIYLLLVIFLLAGGLFYGYQGIKDYLSNTFLCYLFGIIICDSSSVIIYLLIRQKLTKKITLYYFSVFAFYLILSFLIIFGLKYLACRPRFYFIITQDNPSNYYRTWYDFDQNLISEFKTLPSEYFRSFPSGHTTFATSSYLFLLFLDNIKKKKVKISLKTVIFIYPLLTMLARILDGSHFISDVTFSYLISLIIYFVALIAFKYPLLYSTKKSAIKKTSNSPLGLDNKRYIYLSKNEQRYLKKIKAQNNLKKSSNREQK